MGKPVSNGVLTTDTIEQAIERAGSKVGNKGAEAMITIIEMLDLYAEMGEIIWQLEHKQESL